MSKEFIKFKGKIIGTIDYDKGIYISKRTRKHEFIRFNRGFGLSVGILDYLDSKGIDKVLVIYEDTEALWASTDDFLLRGEDWDDNGDKQIILGGQYWKKKLETEIQTKI